MGTEIILAILPHDATGTRATHIPLLSSKFTGFTSKKQEQ